LEIELPAVGTSGALKEQYGDWHLVAGRHQEPQKRTQGNGGSQKKITTSCRGITQHAIPVRHKGHCWREQDKDKAV
jgi:hypothetical protein